MAARETGGHFFCTFGSQKTINMRRKLSLLLFAFLFVLAARAQDEMVVFSAPGGFYADSFSLELYNIVDQNHIRYTINGNRPNACSPLYSAPLMLDERLYSKSDIYTIVNSPEPDFFLADSVRHCIVIRAAVFDENDSCVSEVRTNSYFIQSLGCDTHGLPAISLCADSLDLFDYETGILIPGIHFDPENAYFTGNYFMKGIEWERACNFEFYELDNDGVNQTVGLRTHGKKARWQTQKGLKIYAREEYGKKRIKHKFFDELELKSFKHLCMKPFMSAWNGSGCKDYISNKLAEPLNIESLASRPTVLFLNGEYWGIYYIEEKPDERFLEDHLDVSLDSLNIIDIWNDADYGTASNFYALRNWMQDADLTDEEQYAYAEQQIDIQNFIDYYVLELFIANPDWPAQNVKMWQVGDGIWRWIFYDGDGCLEQQTLDVFANATYEGDATYPSSRRATLFFRQLLKNENFKSQFSQRFRQLVETEFSYQNTKPHFDYIKQTLEEEVPNQRDRFNVPSSMSSWTNYSMNVIDCFLRERPTYIIDELFAFLATDESLIQDFALYPNPSTGEMHIIIESEVCGQNEIAIYDMMGRKVFSTNCWLDNGFNDIVIQPNVSAGLYVIKIGSITQRIVRY